MGLAHINIKEKRSWKDKWKRKKGSKGLKANPPTPTTKAEWKAGERRKTKKPGVGPNPATLDHLVTS